MNYRPYALIATFALMILAAGLIIADDAAAMPVEGMEQATTASEFFDNMVDLFFQVFQAIVDAVVAPFVAFSTIWSNWASELGQWYAPILLIVVIVGALLIWRGYMFFDKFLDSTS